jgi:hypothetical protein
MASSRGESDEEESRHLIVYATQAGADTVAVVDGNPLRLMFLGQGGPSTDTRPSPVAVGGAWLLGDSLLVVVDGWDSRADLYQAGEAGLRLARTASLPARASAVRSGPAEEVWSAVLGDDRGNVWIRDGSIERLPTEAGERWLRWNLADESFAWVDVPPRVQVFRFREGHMVGRERGALGESRLVLYRIVP